MCALAPNTFVAPSTKTIVTLCHLHPLAKVDLPPFVNNFHPETNLVLEKETFIFTLTCFHISHLMVPQVCRHITCGHVPPSISRLLVALRLLALEKQIEGIYHCDWRGNLSVSHPHIGYLVQRYICKTF